MNVKLYDVLYLSNFYFKVTGQYSVLLPDGRIQTVTYSVAPDTGFVVSVICV